MKTLLGVIVPGVFSIITGVSFAQDQSPVFTCGTVPAVFELGLIADLQRQVVIISGVVSVNCCATKEYTSELDNGILKVTLMTHGPCLCPDQPCRIELGLGIGNRMVSRVMVMVTGADTAKTIVLDTALIQTGLARKNATIAKNVAPGNARIVDLRGRVTNIAGKPSDIPLARFPRGVYLIDNHGHSVRITVQP